MREKYYWLAGSCWLVLVWYDRKTLLVGCSEQSVKDYRTIYLIEKIMIFRRSIQSGGQQVSQRETVLEVLVSFIVYFRDTHNRIPGQTLQE